MSKSKVHVLIPYTTEAACGAANVGTIGAIRSSVTCKPCRKTKEFKDLPAKYPVYNPKRHKR